MCGVFYVGGSCVQQLACCAVSASAELLTVFYVCMQTNMLIAGSSSMCAEKLCSNIILHLLVGGGSC